MYENQYIIQTELSSNSLNGSTKAINLMDLKTNEENQVLTNQNNQNSEYESKENVTQSQTSIAQRLNNNQQVRNHFII